MPVRSQTVVEVSPEKQNFKDGVRPDSVRTEQTGVQFTDTAGLELPVSFNVRVYKGNKQIQAFSYKYIWSWNLPNTDVDAKIRLCDVDFDGNKDLLINLGAYGNQGITYYDCYLWNVEHERFSHFPVFKEIGNPKIVASDRVIISSSRSSAVEYLYSKYKIQAGVLLKLATLAELYSQDHDVRRTETIFDSKGRLVSQKAITDKAFRQRWNSR